eukprot:jgi/Tetstr1/454242/TSEL_041161.t1
MPPSTHAKGFKRTLPRPIAAVAADEDATVRETFPDDAHAVTRMVRDGLERHGEAEEAVVHVIGGHDVQDGKYVVLDCHLDHDAVARVVQRLCERSVRHPFERKAVVHTYHMDSLTYSVEQWIGAGGTKVRCWDERCCELSVRPALRAAVSYQRRDNVRPWTSWARTPPVRA